MPSLSPLEILVVLVIALVVFGPEKLPQMARNVGRAANELRRMATEVRGEFQDTFTVDDEDDDPPHNKRDEPLPEPPEDPEASDADPGPPGEPVPGAVDRELPDEPEMALEEEVQDTTAETSPDGAPGSSTSPPSPAAPTSPPAPTQEVPAGIAADEPDLALEPTTGESAAATRQDGATGTPGGEATERTRSETADKE